MAKFSPIFLLIILIQLFNGQATSQAVKDSSGTTTNHKPDSTKNKTKEFSPGVATRRSAIIPGWGQVYNKKYWKVPLVYGALGVTAGVFYYNMKTYRLLRDAYIYATDTDAANDTLIDPRFQNLSDEAIRTYRNEFRQNVDYSVLFFILFWGLNIVDATVDAHLRKFDVNDNLSLQLKQGYSPMANTTGLSLVLDIHSKKFKPAK